MPRPRIRASYDHPDLPDPVNVQAERAARENLRNATTKFFATVLGQLQMMLAEGVPLARVNRLMAELSGGHESWISSIADLEDSEHPVGTGGFGGATALGGMYELKEAVQGQTGSQRLRALAQAVSTARESGDSELEQTLLSALRSEVGLAGAQAADPRQQYQDANFRGAGEEIGEGVPVPLPMMDPLTGLDPDDDGVPF